MFSHVYLFVTLWTVAHQTPLPTYSPDKNTGVSSHSLLKGNLWIQGLNPDLLHYRQILYYLSHQGSPLLSWILLNLWSTIFLEKCIKLIASFIFIACMLVFPVIFKANTIHRVLDPVLCFSCAFSHVTTRSSSTAEFYDHCFNKMKLILSLIIIGNGAQTQVYGILNFNFSKCMLIFHQDFNTLNTSPCI